MYFVWELVCESCGCLYMYQICVLRVRLKGDVRQSTLCMGCLRSHHFYCVCEYVLYCLFLRGVWCELVCVCTRERGGFLFGVGWVALVVNKSLGMMSCLSLCTALWCINLHFNACMTVFFHLSFILGFTTFGKSVMAVFWLFLLGLVHLLPLFLPSKFCWVLASAAFW